MPTSPDSVQGCAPGARSREIGSSDGIDHPSPPSKKCDARYNCSVPCCSIILTAPADQIET